MNRKLVKIWAIRIVTVCLMALPTAVLMTAGKSVVRKRLRNMEESGRSAALSQFMHAQKLSRNDVMLLMDAFQYKFPNNYVSQVGSIAIMILLYKAISIGLCALFVREAKAQSSAAGDSVPVAGSRPPEP